MGVVCGDRFLFGSLGMRRRGVFGLSLQTKLELEDRYAGGCLHNLWLKAHYYQSTCWAASWTGGNVIAVHVAGNLKDRHPLQQRRTHNPADFFYATEEVLRRRS